MFDLPRELQLVWWGVFGLFVGSFLNVAIHRLPLDGETVSKPRRSRCPSCKTELTWRENIPLLSWLSQLGKCRSCGWRIPWRYPLVEVLTAVLWVVAAALAPEGRFDVTLVWVVALSGLIVATFVDFACFEIPDEISIGGMVLAPLVSLAVPVLHSEGFVARAVADGVEPDRLAALISSLCGLAVGGGVLIAIGWLGKLAFSRDAMGFGDVKLLAAGGGLVGAERVLAALVVAAFAASIVGLINMLRFLWLSRSRSRRRGGTKPFAKSLASARICGRYLPFGPYLALGIGIVLLAWDDVRRLALSWLS